MSSSYVRDLTLEVALKLQSLDVYSLVYTTNSWAVLQSPSIWTSKFIIYTGAIKTTDKDNELGCIILEHFIAIANRYRR